MNLKVVRKVSFCIGIVAAAAIPLVPFLLLTICLYSAQGVMHLADVSQAHGAGHRRQPAWQNKNHD